MRTISIWVLSTVLLLTTAAPAAPLLCTSIHTSAEFSQAVRILENEDLQVSELNLTPTDLSSNPNSAMEQLIYMTSQNSQFVVVPKETLEKNQVILALPLKDGYIVEMVYSSKSQVTPSFTLDKIDMVSSSGRKTISKDPVDFNQFVLKKTNFKLDGVFPSGLEVHAAIPLKIDGQVLSDFTERILPLLPLFRKSELAQLTKDHKLSRLKYTGQARSIGKFFKEALFSKSTLRKIILYGSFVAIAAEVGGGFRFQELRSPSTPTAQSQEWVGNMGTSLGMTLGKASQNEILTLNKEIAKQLHQKALVHFSPDLSKPGMKIGDQNFAWLIENPTYHKTYLVFSRDQSNGSIEYFSIAVDPQQYPNLVSNMNRAGLQLEIK